MPTNRCQAITQMGKLCQWRGTVRDTPDGPRCPAHDPSRRAEFRAQAQVGGARSAVVRGSPAINPTSLSDWPLAHGHGPDTAQECEVVATWAIHAVAMGKLDTKVSREISVMINAKLRALNAGRLGDKLAAVIARQEQIAKNEAQRRQA